MITKTQWNKFCLDVWYLHSKLGYGNVTVGGRGLKGIEVRGDTQVLITTRAGEPPLLYTYDKSIEGHIHLAYLYSKVEVDSNMNALFPFLKRNEWLRDRRNK